MSRGAAAPPVNQRSSLVCRARLVHRSREVAGSLRHDGLVASAGRHPRRVFFWSRSALCAVLNAPISLPAPNAGQAGLARSTL